MSMLRDRIAAYVPAADPRHVEAWLRDQHGTLDSVDAITLAASIFEAADLAKTDPALSEQLAQSYGLRS